jgi:excisionase family DNA binding protein
VATEQSEYMTPAEVARVFRVDPKTVTRWARRGRFSTVRTPGGHRRFRRAEVEAALAGSSYEADAPVQQYPR